MSLEGRLSGDEGDKPAKDEGMSGKIGSMDSFPVDDTPTPTRILRLANDLFPDFHDPKENPFDAHFRKATEAVKSGEFQKSSWLRFNCRFSLNIYKKGMSLIVIRLFFHSFEFGTAAITEISGQDFFLFCHYLP